MIAEMPPQLSLRTPIDDLHKFGLGRLGQILSHKLALALASHFNKKSSKEVTVEDLLNYLPMRYEDRSKPARIRDLTPGVEASLELQVKVSGGYQVRNRRSAGRSRLFIFEISATDPERTGKPVVVWWFVSGTRSYDIVNYYKKRLIQGSRFITFGKWDWDDRRATFALRLHRPADELEMLPPAQARIDVEERREDDGELEEPETDPQLAVIHTGRRVPIYRKLGEFSSKRLREIVHGTLEKLPDSAIPETLPADLLRRQKLIDRPQALRQIHFPDIETPLALYDQSRSPAHARLIFEDLFWVALGINLKRGKRVKESKGASIRIDRQMKLRIGGVLPFKLTEAQRKVVKEIFKDLQSTAPMNRLLQGDVGSGKTIVALIAMLAVMENGYQTALMAPTEILAEQHARNIKRLLRQNLRTALNC